MGLLDGKTAIITGGTSGIGLATAARFLDEGARVFITGRRQSELDAALARLGDRASGVRGDVGVGADLDRLYAAVAESGRGLDIVVANAGVTAVARIGDITEHHLDTLVSTNVKGVVFTVQKVLPVLNDGASIIVTGSTTAERGREGVGIYAATKAAVRSLARTWANELKGPDPSQRDSRRLHRDTWQRQSGWADQSGRVDNSVPRRSHCRYTAGSVRRT
jgi:NAD(P)-dependent dehydrogenase (short-subunit alcohol dehydrogenase family)